MSLIGSPDGPLGWRRALGYGAITSVAGAAFPRLLAWSVRPARLGPRGLAASIVLNTAIGFAVHTWVLPYLKRKAAELQRGRTQLAQTLGREPTDGELFEHLGLTRRR